MNMAVVYSRACSGIKSPLVSVEVHLSRGLPSMTIVGLPATAVKESKDRVRSALVNSGFDFPLRRITINLAPADLPKQGGRFDLPIALGILAASQQLPNDLLSQCEFIGELALSGQLRAVQAVLPFVIAAQQHQRHCIIPADNAQEASYVEHQHAFSAPHLLDVVAHLQQKNTLNIIPNPPRHNDPRQLPDIADVQAQLQARRALEIAAAGGHNLMMIGPPGVGKSMLASRLPGLLPPLENQQRLDVGSLHCLHHQGLAAEQWQHPPFRSPHHSISTAALIGGGNPPCPGEISLAHHGVLFLDELPEFQRSAKEALREPLETGQVCIARAKHSLQFPARFQLIAAMNPCPCGYADDKSGQCQCAHEQIKRYQARVSGPLLDRIDIKIRLHPVDHHLLIQPKKQENSQTVRERICKARDFQIQRQGTINTRLNTEELQQHLQLSEDAKKLWIQQSQRRISARAMVKLLKVARTIADLQHSNSIKKHHITESMAITSNHFFDL